MRCGKGREDVMIGLRSRRSCEDDVGGLGDVPCFVCSRNSWRGDGGGDDRCMRDLEKKPSGINQIS